MSRPLRPAAALLALCLAAPALGLPFAREASTGFEDGGLPAGWSVTAGRWGEAGIVWDPAHARTGEFAARLAILPATTSNTGSALVIPSPGDGDVYELEALVWTEGVQNHGMETTVLLLTFPDRSGSVGVQVSPDVGGQPGYYGTYTGTAGSYGTALSFPQGAWHLVKVRYDRRAQAMEAWVDGALLVPSTPVVGAVGAPDGAMIYVAGGWAPGNPIVDFLDDVALRVVGDDATAPAVVAVSPLAGASGVGRAAPATVTFSEPVVAGPAVASVRVSCGKAQAVTVSVSGSVLTAQPAARLPGDSTCTVTVPAGAVADLVGNPSTQGYTFRFTTAR